MNLQHSYICIGAGSLADNLIKKWVLLGVGKPRIIFDSDINKEGKKIEGIDIVHTTKINQLIQQDEKVIITSSFVEEIKNGLIKLALTNEVYDYKQFDLSVIQFLFLNNNKPLVNSYKGKRCFIIGNGPSLRNQDLLYLKNEVKIMVNQFYRSKDLLDLKPQFWMLADPLYWEQIDEYLEPILQTVQNDLKETTLFLPQESLENLIKHKKEVKNPTLKYYYMDKYSDISKYSDSQSTEIDFTQTVPPFAQNVVSPSLMLALFLGFKEIYLIGCDHTWWGFNKFEVEQEGKILPYYYSKSKESIAFQRTYIRNFGYEKLQDTINRQIFEYEILNEYAKKQGAKIFNSTEGGYLETFERKDYDSIFELNQKGV